MTAPGFRWGLVGPGRIAHQFADALRGVEGGARLVSVQGRDAHRAADFAQRWGAAQATDSLAELLANPALQAVYIATPRSSATSGAPAWPWSRDREPSRSAASRRWR